MYFPTVDGRKVTDMPEPMGYVFGKKVGDTITLMIHRGKEGGDVRIRLAEVPTG